MPPPTTLSYCLSYLSYGLSYGALGLSYAPPIESRAGGLSITVWFIVAARRAPVAVGEDGGWREVKGAGEGAFGASGRG